MDKRVPGPHGPSRSPLGGAQRKETSLFPPRAATGVLG